MKSIPTYEEFIEHKRLTLKQHEARMKKYQELYGVRVSSSGEFFANGENEKGNENTIPNRRGICQECGNGGFKLAVAADGQIERTCMQCGAEKLI